MSPNLSLCYPAPGKMELKLGAAWPVTILIGVALALGVGIGVLFLLWWLLPWLGGELQTPPEFRGMELARIALINDLGERVELEVRVADEPAEQLAGFQHIGRRVIARSAILFVFPRPIRGEFHMRNVVAPLDIAFFAADGRALAVMRMEPGPELYGPDEPFQYALETAAGRLAELHISPQGSRLLPP